MPYYKACNGYMLTNLKINPAATTWTQLVQEGQPIGNFITPIFLGVDANGNAIYKDVNKNGTINVESETDRQTAPTPYSQV